MSGYSFTPRGVAIAEQSGLDKLVKSLTAPGDPSEPILVDMLENLEVGHSFRPPDVRELTIASEISSAAKDARDLAELRTISRGLEIDPETDRWRYLTESPYPTLFPYDSTLDLASASYGDRLVLSGVLGHSLRRFRTRYPLLSRSRSAEFGFSNYMEACAFVGAYVLGSIYSTANERLFGTNPHFVIEGSGANQIVEVGATMHGDFLIGQKLKFDIPAISQANNFVEFAPDETMWVGAYHSVEPDIIASLILDELNREGRQSALKLIEDIEESIKNFYVHDKIEFHAGPFGDYGSNYNSSIVLSTIRRTVESPEYITWMMKQGKLLSFPYQPQSNHLFEIKRTPVGVRFQIRKNDQEDGLNGIDIPRSFYPQLVRAIFQQAQLGMGRTSPMEIIKLLIDAKLILTQ